MQKCGFFDANLNGGEYDRVYLAAQFAEYFASFVGNGVYAQNGNQLQVMAQSNPAMSVQVLSGQGWINGYWYENSDALSLSVDIADGVLNRIDSIVLRLGFSERNMWLAIKKGTPASAPSAPVLTRGADYYELQLATVSVPAGSIKITQAQITDTRLDTNVCGWVTGVVDQIDTTTLFNQFEAYFGEFKQTNEAEFNTWFTHIKDELSESAAGNLQLQIDDHETRLDANEAEISDHETRLTTLEDAGFAVMKREQMAPYGYFGVEQNLNTLMGYVRAGQWDKFAVGDYFIDTRSNGQKVMWEVADKNGYLHVGNQGDGLTSNSIICIPRDCIEETQQYNTTNKNAGGYAASIMPAALEAIANTFSSKLQSYMTSVSRLENNKGGWAWASRRIMLPSVTEVFGHQGFSDGFSGGPISHSLALFTGGNAHLMKGRGFNKSLDSRQWYWTEDPVASNAVGFCSVTGTGDSGNSDATVAGGLAPLIILT